jgi:hypothetical protein
LFFIDPSLPPQNTNATSTKKNQHRPKEEQELQWQILEPQKAIATTFFTF